MRASSLASARALCRASTPTTRFVAAAVLAMAPDNGRVTSAPGRWRPSRWDRAPCCRGSCTAARDAPAAARAGRNARPDHFRAAHGGAGAQSALDRIAAEDSGFVIADVIAGAALAAAAIQVSRRCARPPLSTFSGRPTSRRRSCWRARRAGAPESMVRPRRPARGRPQRPFCTISKPMRPVGREDRLPAGNPRSSSTRLPPCRPRCGGRCPRATAAAPVGREDRRGVDAAGLREQLLRR